MTELKSVFLDKEVKKIIELHMNLSGFSTRNDALVDLLKDCDRYKELTNMLNNFKTK